MRSIFVTGTDTEVGKTVVTGLLARYLLVKGYNVITQKWIQTGSDDISDDIKEHLKFSNRKIKDYSEHLPAMSPYVFGFPASPHLAARLEKKTAKVSRIKKSFNRLGKKFDFVIVEGVGGALVPLDKKTLMIDIAKELKMPVIIVAANKLGAVNHTLLTVEAIRNRGMDILGIVFNNISSGQKIILEDNPKIIKEISGERILGVLPKLKNKNELAKKFDPIGQNIISAMNR